MICSERAVSHNPWAEASVLCPEGGCYEIGHVLPREELKNEKFSGLSIPGKNELFWREVAQGSGRSRVAQKGLSTQ